MQVIVFELRHSDDLCKVRQIQGKPMQRFFIFAGMVMLVVGIFWPWISRLPLGRLPGDISIVREGFSFYFPVTTGLLVSLVITVLVWIFRR